MPIPVWVLLLFSVWTLLTLIGSVGVYRLSRIYSGKARVRDYNFPDLETSDWHRRATRAHLNCVENLPVYGAIVVAILATGLRSSAVDGLAIAFLAARVCHTLVHLLLPQNGRVIQLRFFLFVAQVGCMLGMAGIVAAATL